MADIKTKRLAELHEEYKAASKQLSHTLDEVNRLRIKRRIEEIEREITQVEQGTAPPLLPIPLELPATVEHFTGRETELVQLLTDLQPGRILTLTGPGGIGKSALAAEALRRLAPGDGPPDRFPDGIIFHNFHNQPQVALALEAIARAFDEEPRPTPYDAARRVLAGRRALLLLDGAENADDLGAVLEVRGGCGVLITSRQRKDAAAGWQDIVPLPPDEAVALLQAWGGARAADETATRQICELVGGLPLAVRLTGRYLAQMEEEAADYLAWLKEMPLQALDHGQRRLESVPYLLERSLDRVSEETRQVLAVVGLLALAPFGREVVAAALEVSAGQVSRWLGELVNYGLLLGSGRHYEVSHVLVHTYAHRRMGSGEAVGRVAAYYNAFASEQRKLGLEGYARLDVERAHLMAVLTNCVERENWEAGRGLVWVMDSYLDIRGYWTERKTAIKAGLAAVRVLRDRQGEGAFLSNLGSTYIALGQVEKAIEFYEQALLISHEIEYRQGEGADLGNLGLAYGTLGQVEKAIEFYQQALAISHEIGDRRGEGNQLGNLGNAYSDLGQVERAIEFYEQALLISHEIGDRRGEGAYLGNLGNAYSGLGQVEKAIELYQQALDISREIGDRQGEGNRLGNLGLAYRDLGQVERAIEFHEQALAISREISDRRSEGADLGNLGAAYRNLGRLEQAQQYLEQGLTILEEIKSPYAEQIRGWWQDTLLQLGQQAEAANNQEAAVDYYETAYQLFIRLGDKDQANDLAYHIATLFEAQGEQLRTSRQLAKPTGQSGEELARYQDAGRWFAQALSLSAELNAAERYGFASLGQGRSLVKSGAWYQGLDVLRHKALPTFRRLENLPGKAQTFFEIGLAHQRLGDYEVARMYYKDAMRHYRQLKDEVGSARVKVSLSALAIQMQELEQAISLLEQALPILQQQGEEMQVARARELLTLTRTALQRQPPPLKAVMEK